MHSAVAGKPWATNAPSSAAMMWRAGTQNKKAVFEDMDEEQCLQAVVLEKLYSMLPACCIVRKAPFLNAFLTYYSTETINRTGCNY